MQPQLKKIGDKVHCMDMSGVFDISVVRERIAARMKQLGTSQYRVAVDAGLGQTAVRDIVKGKTNDISGSTLVKLADVLETTVDELVSLEPPVLLVGNIGAGGSILFDEEAEPIAVPRPPMATGRIVALEVRGESMFPKYESGDIIYIRRDHDGVLPQYVGYHCAVALADGGTFLKVLEEGTEPGRWSLMSHNAPPMRNVEILWASPVLFVLPKRPPQNNL